MSDVPRLYRLVLQVSDLDEGVKFYSGLLGVEGRLIPGSRAYFDCGDVILALLDPTRGGEAPRPSGDIIYFAVHDLETVHRRASKLGCLATGDVHGEDAGAIVWRPWGERSFYVRDPWNNQLCFVDEATLFIGR